MRRKPTAKEINDLKHVFSLKHVLIWAEERGTRAYLYRRAYHPFGTETEYLDENYFTITKNPITVGTYLAKVLNVIADKNGYPVIITVPVLKLSEHPATIPDDCRTLFKYLSSIPDLFVIGRVPMTGTDETHFNNRYIRNYVRRLCYDQDIKDKYGYPITMVRAFWLRKTPEVVFELLVKYKLDIKKLILAIQNCSCHSAIFEIGIAADKFVHDKEEFKEKYPITYEKLDRMCADLPDYKDKTEIAKRYIHKMMDSYLSVFDDATLAPLDMVERINAYYRNKNAKAKQRKERK